MGIDIGSRDSGAVRPDSKKVHAASLYAILEASALIGAVAAFEVYFKVGFDGLLVHPFLFVVLLCAVQYGVPGGVFSALAAIAVKWAISWPIRSFDEDYFDFALREWSEPLLWFAVALLVGIVRSRQISREMRLTEELAHAKLESEAISDHCEQLRSRTRRLEHELSALGGAAFGPADGARVAATRLALSNEGDDDTSADLRRDVGTRHFKEAAE